MPGLPSVSNSSQAWASIASAWSTSFNAGWIADFRLGSTGGFTVNCEPTSSGYIFTSSGDGTTGASGNGFYALGRAVRILQDSTTFYGRVASAAVAAGVTTVGLSSGSVTPTAGLSTGVAFTAVAVGIDPGTATLAASTAPSATAKYHREDGTWAAPTATNVVKEVGWARVDTAETTTSATFTDLASAGPSVTMTADLNDDLYASGTCDARNDTAGASHQVAPKLDAVGTSLADGTNNDIHVGASYRTMAFVTQFLNQTAASHTVKMQYNAAGGGTSTFVYRKMMLTRAT
ncbi:MAG: hypothetical protein NUW01_11680 [Gemmatimonadaceae bacterium]|nr:hypothetical protein [Gemmatimonadaceae bacterium]